MEALGVIESAYGVCKAALADSNSNGGDRQEILQDYPHRSSGVLYEISFEEYVQYQFRSEAIFKILCWLEALKAQILSANEEEEQSFNVLTNSPSR